MAMEMPEFHLERFLPYLVHRVGSQLAEGFEEQFAEAGVSLPEWRVLAVLFEYGPQSMGDIARRTSINASTMTRLIGQMEKRNLVERARPAANQRTVNVWLLQSGNRAVATLLPKVLDYEKKLSACFSGAELETFKILLTKFFNTLTSDASSEDERLAS